MHPFYRRGSFFLAVLLGMASPVWAEPDALFAEFLGWDFERVGFDLSPGEALSLRFRNGEESPMALTVAWDVTPYVAGPTLASGSKTEPLESGDIINVPLELPDDLADGPCMIHYTLTAGERQSQGQFHFDFRRPAIDPAANLTVLAVVENADPEGWTRMVLGPMRRFVNVVASTSQGEGAEVDVALVIAQAKNTNDARVANLLDFVKSGGKAVVFGKPGEALADMLPVVLDADQPLVQQARTISTVTTTGPWIDFDTTHGPGHYPVRVQAKDGAEVLAQWDDGSPAVVVGQWGEGQVVYVATGSYQVWQEGSALDEADELAVRLMYWLARGEEGVEAALAKAQEENQRDADEQKALRDWVLEDTSITPPEVFTVVSRNNAGRFGWVVGDGTQAEEVFDDGSMGSSSGGKYAWCGLSFDDGTAIKQAIKVDHNWFAKAITWELDDGATVRSTLSLGAPGTLWEGTNQQVSLHAPGVARSVAYPTADGVRIAAPGDAIDPLEITSNWLLCFVPDATEGDSPRLLTLTRRPIAIEVGDNLRLTFDNEQGFEALCTTLLYGIRHLETGHTAAWREALPQEVAAQASRMSAMLMQYPVRCEEIGWVDDGDVMLVDRIEHRTLENDWAVTSQPVSVVPPVIWLAKSVGAPVSIEGESEAQDWPCATKAGPMRSIAGDRLVMRITMPPDDHRAPIAVAGQEAYQKDAVDSRATLGLRTWKFSPNSSIDEGDGRLHIDLAAYLESDQHRYDEAPSLDLYKWLYTFGALISRPVYSDAMREEVDEHFRLRFWETLNYYGHKTVVRYRREPWSGADYMIGFVWPTQTIAGFRNFNDGNESSGLVSYCLSNYGRYYGDWRTLRANWNLCRRQYGFLPRVNDWAIMSSGALEYFYVSGLDMLNAEYIGGMSYAYSAEQVGQEQDAVVGRVLGIRALVTSVARFGFIPYLKTIAPADDPWFEGTHYWWIGEQGVYLSGDEDPTYAGIDMVDTSKGTAHELLLAYKAWCPQYSVELEKLLEGEGHDEPWHLVNRVMLGWPTDEAQPGDDRQPLAPKQKAAFARELADNWIAPRESHDMATLGMRDLPVVLADWSPAAYIKGSYDPESRQMSLQFQNDETGDCIVKLYAPWMPKELRVNGEAVEASPETWQYDPEDGLLRVALVGSGRNTLDIEWNAEIVGTLHLYVAPLSTAVH